MSVSKIQKIMICHIYPIIIVFKMPRCAYCTTNYTVIAKAETFKEDLRCHYIILITILLLLLVDELHEACLHHFSLYFMSFSDMLEEEIIIITSLILIDIIHVTIMLIITIIIPCDHNYQL